MAIKRGAIIRVLVSVHDAVAIGAGLLAATLLITSGAALFDPGFVRLVSDAILFGIGGAAVTHLFGLNRAIWRYASLGELRAIVLACLIIFVLAVGFGPVGLNVLWHNSPSAGTATLFLACLLAALFLGGTRFGYRLLRNRRSRGRGLTPQAVPVVYFGNTTDAELLVRRQKEMGADTIDVVLVLDPRSSQQSGTVRGIPVVATIEALTDRLRPLAEADRLPTHIFVPAGVDVPRATLRAAYLTCHAFGMRLYASKPLDDMNSKRDGDIIRVARPKFADLFEAAKSRDANTGFAELADRSVAVIGVDQPFGRDVALAVASAKPTSLVMAGDEEAALAAASRMVRQHLQPQGVHIAAGLGRWGQGLALKLGETKPAICFIPMLVADPLRPDLSDQALLRRTLVDFARTLDIVLSSAPEIVVVVLDPVLGPETGLRRICLDICERMIIAEQARQKALCVPLRTGLVLSDTAVSVVSDVPVSSKRLSQLFHGRRLAAFHSAQVTEAMMTTLDALRQSGPVSDLLLGTDGGLPVSAAELKAWADMVVGTPVQASASPASNSPASAVASKAVARSSRDGEGDPQNTDAQMPIAPLFRASEQPRGSMLPGLLSASVASGDYAARIAAIHEVELALSAGRVDDAVAIVRALASPERADAPMA
ncbi:MAG: hypothetical protein AAFY53_04745 [Pseudomonadota bacterium]